MKNLFGLNEENKVQSKRIKPKRKRNAIVHLIKCKPGREAWKTLLVFLRARIPPGKERAKGK